MEVKVVPHQPAWSDEFETERSRIVSELDDLSVYVHHIGSTSVPGIWAKPIIDILIEVANIQSLDEKKGRFEDLGYECLGEFGIEGRRYFRKDNNDGIRTHHIHAFASGSHNALRHLAFRDFLISHPEIAREYDELKKTLAKKHPDDMNAYIEGKSVLIKELEAQAVSWCKSKKENDKNQSAHTIPASAPR